MKKSRRMLLIVLALALCLAVTVSALAEGALGTLYRAATALLFDTDNVTLTAHATFTYDGDLFKTLDATCVQDGSDSKLNLMLKTPKEDGTIYEGGYTVVANDGIAYSIETAQPQVYSTSVCSTAPALLSTSTLRRAIVELGGAIAESCEGAFADKITTSAGTNGTRYQITLAAGDAPRLVNAAGTLLAQAAVQRFFYINSDYVAAQYAEQVKYCEVYYEDYDQNFAVAYQSAFGEPFPEDFYDMLWGEDGSLNEALYERYNTVSEQLYELMEDVRSQYQDGVAMILTDGTVKHYATEDEFMIENGQQSVYFESFDALFLAAYQEKTGAVLTMPELRAIQRSYNMELTDAYDIMWEDLYDELYHKYWEILAADGQHAMLVVKADGSYRLIDDVDAYWMSQGGGTMTEQLRSTLERLTLGETDVTVETDAQGRFTAARGKVCILVEDILGYVRPLEIEFDLAAGDYGVSAVEQFDPAVYGVMNWEEYAEAFKRGEITLPGQEQLPDVVTFNGVEYETLVEDWGDNG